jgi:hypothetical protein
MNLLMSNACLHAFCVPRAEHKVAMQGIVRLLQIL